MLQGNQRRRYCVSKFVFQVILHSKRTAHLVNNPVVSVYVNMTLNIEDDLKRMYL
jgi:hypothetical protein